MISHEQRCAIKVTWREGDIVEVRGRQGLVRYVYTNGFTLIQFLGAAIKGGIFNNNSTFSNEQINS